MSRPAEHLQYLTYADYAAWPDNVRGELIGGVFYAMNSPQTRHQRLATRVTAQLVTQLRGKRCEPFAAPIDVLLVQPGQSIEDCEDVVQPDLLIVCEPDKVQEKFIRGAPDWVLEILSPSTARLDQVRKLALYERAGVHEFWMVDPDSRVLTIYAADSANRGYGRPRVMVAEGAVALTAVEDVTIDWDEAFA